MYKDNFLAIPSVLRAGTGDGPVWSPSEGEVDLSLFARTDTPRLADSNSIQDGNSELFLKFSKNEKKKESGPHPVSGRLCIEPDDHLWSPGTGGAGDVEGPPSVSPA